MPRTSLCMLASARIGCMILRLGYLFLAIKSQTRFHHPKANSFCLKTLMKNNQLRSIWYLRAGENTLLNPVWSNCGRCQLKLLGRRGFQELRQRALSAKKSHMQMSSDLCSVNIYCLRQAQVRPLANLFLHRCSSMPKNLFSSSTSNRADSF